MVQKGQIVRSLAGHDKGDFQVVIKADLSYAIVCDGKRRSLVKPKRKKIKHLAKTTSFLSEEELGTDRRIRNALKKFQDSAGE